MARGGVVTAASEIAALRQEMAALATRVAEQDRLLSMVPQVQRARQEMAKIDAVRAVSEQAKAFTACAPYERSAALRAMSDDDRGRLLGRFSKEQRLEMIRAAERADWSLYLASDPTELTSAVHTTTWIEFQLGTIAELPAKWATMTKEQRHASLRGKLEPCVRVSADGPTGQFRSGLALRPGVPFIDSTRGWEARVDGDYHRSVPGDTELATAIESGRVKVEPASDAETRQFHYARWIQERDYPTPELPGA